MNARLGRTLDRLEDRTVPSVALAATYALGADTRTFGSSVYDDPSGIRNRTGDPSLGSPAVIGFAADGSMDIQSSYGSAFSGGVRVARMDLGQEPRGQYAVATAPGVPNFVEVIAGPGAIFRAVPFEPSFTGGVNVSTGDLNGDGLADLIVSPDEGGGPRVDVYESAGFQYMKVASFLGIDDVNFRGGVRTAVGDLNNDGAGDLIVAAGFGGGPRVAVYDGQSVVAGSPVKLFNDFFVFESTLRNGAYVTAGDLNGDGFDEIIAGGGPAGGPRVLAVSGKDLMTSGGTAQTPLANFFAGSPDNRAGVRVVAKNLDGDGVADLVAAEGPSGDRNNTNHTVRQYAGKAIVAGGTPAALATRSQFGVFTFDSFLDGVYVG